MVERSLSMREAPGSIPGFSNMKTNPSSEKGICSFCSAGMILDGSGDGLQIHWSLTWQRFDSSFSASFFLKNSTDLKVFLRIEQVTSHKSQAKTKETHSLSGQPSSVPYRTPAWPKYQIPAPTFSR